MSRDLKSLFSAGELNTGISNSYVRSTQTSLNANSKTSSKLSFVHRQKRGFESFLNDTPAAKQHKSGGCSFLKSNHRQSIPNDNALQNLFSVSNDVRRTSRPVVVNPVDLDVSELMTVVPNAEDDFSTLDVEDYNRSCITGDKAHNRALTDDEGSRNRTKPIEHFREDSTDYLSQFYRLEYPHDVHKVCAICGCIGRSIRCHQCFQYDARCQDCFLKSHQHAPLHIAYCFNDYYWARETQCNLGRVINLGHNGAPCPGLKVRKEEPKLYTVAVLDLDGLQDVTVRFCTCEQSFGVNWQERNQFISVRWFPATTAKPRTVATFNTLDKFEAITFQGKTAAYHFYESLVRLTDSSRCTSISDRYEHFNLMHREYQYLKLLQRGRITPSLEESCKVQQGELAIECPACPQPNKNLPKDWESRIDCWIYTLYIMVDANFRLKLKAKGITDDPELGPGKSYLVEEKPYKEHLSNYTEEKEIKVCTSEFRAIDHANLRGGKGYDASGVVAVQCRHMLVRSNGVADLQKGEKYANVDYTVLSALRNFQLKHLTISYDIACQYHKNFLARVSQYPPDMQINFLIILLVFVIPKFHIAGHGDQCRTRYSLNYQEHMGRTDGENIERGWASLNPLSMSTKEMGPGARHDIMDYHIGDWNHQRVVSFGRIFSARLQEAVKESLRHVAVLKDLNNAFPPAILMEITEAIDKWNKDPDNSTDPYAETKHGTTLLEVRKSLAEAEDKESLLGEMDELAMSASKWLVLGLDLEDAQRSVKRLYRELKSSKLTSTNTVAEEKNVTVNRRIRAWQSYQMIYMPGLIGQNRVVAPDEENGVVSSCWDIELHLPSSVNSGLVKVKCVTGLMEKEKLLRKAQAEDALSEVRVLLQKQWWLTNMKKKHVSGQKMNTKSNAGIQAVRQQRDKHVDRYRAARAAMVKLDPGGVWGKELKILADEDVRALEEREDGKSEGRRSPSWIWGLNGAAVMNKEGEESINSEMKVEWAKSRARASRWLEEVTLVKEEMRRVLCYFEWKADWWLSRGQSEKYEKEDVRKGFIVYANRQSSILRNMAMNFRNEWETKCGVKGLPSFQNLALNHIYDIHPSPLITKLC